MSAGGSSSSHFASLLHVLTLNRWIDSILRERWIPAEEAALTLTGSADSFWNYLGSVNLALTRLYRGRSREALVFLERAAGSCPGPVGALARLSTARVLLERGEAGRALVHAQMAREECAAGPPVLEALFLEALCQESLGRRDEAERSAAELKRRAESFPRSAAPDSLRHIAGALALARGEGARAVHELGEAFSLLSASRSLPTARTRHVPLWFALGRAYLADGDPDEAVSWFRRVAESGGEHIEWPIPYVRSFYFLGTLHQDRGEAELALTYFRRFLEFWGEGDLDPERAKEARGKSA